MVGGPAKLQLGQRRRLEALNAGDGRQARYQRKQQGRRCRTAEIGGGTAGWQRRRQRSYRKAERRRRHCRTAAVWARPFSSIPTGENWSRLGRLARWRRKRRRRLYRTAETTAAVLQGGGVGGGDSAGGSNLGASPPLPLFSSRRGES